MDPVLIWGFGPFPALGIAGAAVATSVGRTIGAAMLIVYLFSDKSLYKFKPSYFIPSFKMTIDIYRIGISSMVRSIGASVAQIIAVRTAASFGTIPLAVVGILFRASGFAFTPCMGIGQGMLPLVGYNYGAKKKERVREIVLKAGLSGFIWGALWWLISLFLAKQVMSIFNADPNFLAAATPAFRIYALGFFTVGAQAILTFAFQGFGKAIPSLIVSLSRHVICLIPCLLIL